MKTRRFIALCLLGAWFASGARADSLAEAFARGNAAFARGAYDNAVREYEALVDAGVDDPDVAFNLASAYGALGRYGPAIRYFERTLRLAPRDAAAREGLRVAREALGERQAQAQGEAIIQDRPPLSEAIFSAFSADDLALSLLASIWLGAVLWLGLPRIRTEALRLGCGIGAALAFALAFGSALGLGAKADWGREGERAVILREGVAIREGPDDRARLAAELAEGEHVRVLAREGRYARILARGERAGYVLGSDVGEL